MVLYQTAVEELRETKRECWTLTNYFIAMHVAAVYYIREMFEEKPPVGMLWLFSVLTLGLLCYLIWRIHWKSTGRNKHHREILVSVTGALGDAFKKHSHFNMDLKKYLSSRWDFSVNIALMSICAITTLFFLVYLGHVFQLSLFSCLRSGFFS